MLASLVFSPVADIGHKTLHAFRKDAGWTNLDSAAHEGALSPGSQVQWATARRSGKVIGIARLELAPPQFCYVSDLIVLGAYRGRGVGAWLMAQIESHCLAFGIPRVILKPNADSLAFYEKLAFVEDPIVAGFLKKEIGLFRRKLLPF